MQLKKLSFLAVIALSVTSVRAEDYVNVQFVGYDEDSGRTTVLAPMIEINKDYGSDYTFKLSFGVDGISGASPTFYDAASGASASSRGTTTQTNVTYGDVEYDDVRKVVAFSATKRFASRDELTVGLGYSDETDYRSTELSGEYLHYLDATKNSAISVGAAYQMNQVLVPCHGGNAQCDAASGSSQAFDINVVNAEIGFTQVIDKTSLVKTSLFYANEDGYLSNPYMNIVRNYATIPFIEAERKPDTRKSYGLTLQYAKAINDQVSTVTDYRYYTDDWEIDSHTLGIEVNYDYSDTWRFGSGIRYYTQSQADFYNASKEYFTDEQYASSDRRMSDLDSINYKISADYKFSKKVSFNAGFDYYDQPDWFNAMYVTLGAKYFF